MRKRTRNKVVVVIAIMACGILGLSGWHLFQAGRDHDAERYEAEVAQGSDDELVKQDEAPYQIFSSASLTIDITDPQVVADQSTNVALVRIDSIDGANNYSEVIDDYVYPYTYGKMTILENIKGNLPIGDQVVFYRMGVVLSIDQYRAGLSDEERTKFDEAREKSQSLSAAEQIEVRFTEDVKPVEGKTYLAYLQPEDSRYAKPNTYGITGLQGGLREVQSTDGDVMRSGTGVQVLNNFTNEWEDLDEVISKSR